MLILPVVVLSEAIESANEYVLVALSFFQLMMLVFGIETE